MSEVKDQAIKLFGRTISFPLAPRPSPNDSSGPPPPDSARPAPRSSSLSEEYTSQTDKEPSRKELTSEQDDGASQQTTEDLKSPTSSGVSEKPKTPSSSVERDNSLLKPSKDGQQSDASTVQEKAPKKPDKILPCPRCNSMDTKFCYYNNYNVNQPRHFCKNCQRYWTAGGTTRNVPVGAGRRKNKSSCASHYRHIMVPESLLMAKANATNGLHNTVLGNGATVLAFGSDSPMCDSIASVLNLAEKTQNGAFNGFRVPEQNIIVSCGREDNINGDDHSNETSVTTSTSSEKRINASSQESVDKSYEALPPQLQCIPGYPWHYPWNPTQWSSSMPPPVFCPPGYPVSIYPTPTYWGCTLPAPRNIPCISPQASVKHSSPSSASNSPTLGKRLRDGSILTPANSQKERPDIGSKNSENGVLIPKTLRIDDPSEAAKSSIRSTLGIKNEKANSLNCGGRGGVFKAFLSRGDDKNHRHVVEALPVLQANPAALSRSIAFHEQQT